MASDRLVIILKENGVTTLTGFYPAPDSASADLKGGFPCEGKWSLDYVDDLGTDKNAHVYAEDVANAMWGTIYSDSGEVIRDDLLNWTSNTETDLPVLSWAVRSEDDYVQACLDSFDQQTAV